MQSMQQEAILGVSQQQRLVLTFAMQQAIEVLQMPLDELSEWLHQEIAENPYLEYSGKSKVVAKEYFTQQESISARSLFDFLMEQARQNFHTETELALAEYLIGCLDDRGFISSEDVTPHMEPILEKIQQFDPPGIGARSLQESLLIQLRLQGKEISFIFRLIEKYYDDLLHHRFSLLAKKMGMSISQLKEKLHEETRSLNFRPASSFRQTSSMAVVPDVILSYKEEKWDIEINDTLLPEFFLKKEKIHDFHYLQRAKWLKKAIENRRKTLRKIADYLVKKQGRYLSGEEDFQEPMTMQEIALALNLHNSTIGRAIGHKHLFCPRGMLAFRSLFTYDLGNAVSNQSAKKILEELIRKENKQNPLSDEALALKISALGIPLARRTVAKYRAQQNILSAKQRRQ